MGNGSTEAFGVKGQILERPNIAEDGSFEIRFDPLTGLGFLGAIALPLIEDYPRIS